MKKPLLLALLLVVCTGGALYRQGAPLYTDGCLWVPTDSCTWKVRAVLPAFTETALQPGDRLLRLDYQPVCSLRSIPPATQAGQLFLYEVRRGSDLVLVFAESVVRFPLGWPSTKKAYQVVRWLSLGLFWLALLTFLLTLERWRWELATWWPEGLLLIGLTLLSGTYWAFWETYGSTRLIAGIVLTSGWALLALKGLPTLAGKLLWLAGIAASALLSSQPSLQAAWTVFALGAPVLSLSGFWRGLYLLGWGGWLLVPDPLWILGLQGTFLCSYAKVLRQTLSLLPVETAWVRAAALGLATAAGYVGYGGSLLQAVGLGAAALLALTWAGQSMTKALRVRQKRVRFLQERLPQLWEILDEERLFAFVRETLQTYVQATQVAWIAEARVDSGRPWLRRSGEPSPVATRECPFEPDAAIPLPRYGWLLLQEGAHRLTPQDLEQLLPFAAGVSIALRHLRLFQAAHEARLAALRGQLSPHFLFNALNTLQALIQENPPLAEELIIEIGSLLRRSLEHARQVTVPLAEELALVRDYLAVEKKRFGDRLQIKWQLPDPPPDIQVPPFALQLLVENTIKHAVSRLARPVTLSLRLEQTTEGVALTVEDDGPGIDPTRIGQRVGLSNLLLRLEQLYPNQAALEIERLDPGTRVTLRFPLPTANPTARSRNPEANRSAHG